MESSDVGEGNDITHDEKHLLLSPFFGDNKLSDLSQHWPPILHTVMILNMRIKLSSLKASDHLKKPILFTGGKGALVRGQCMNKILWTVYGLWAIGNIP